MRLIVKVSDNHKSAIRLHEVEAYRALTLEDIKLLLGKLDSECKAVIIEEPTIEAVEIIDYIKTNYAVEIYTFGDVILGDESIKNFVCLSDLQDEIDTTFGVKTRTYGKDRAMNVYDPNALKNPDGTPYIDPATIKPEPEPEVIEPEEPESYPQDLVDSGLNSENNSQDVEISDSIFSDEDEFGDEPVSDTISGEPVTEETPVEEPITEEVSDSIFDDNTTAEEAVEQVDTIPEAVESPITEEVSDSIFDDDTIEDEEPVIEESPVDTVKPPVEETVEQVETPVEETVDTEPEFELPEAVNINPIPAIEPVILIEENTEAISEENYTYLDKINKAFTDIDITKLENFNKLGDADKELVEALYAELNLYRTMLASLAKSDATVELGDALDAIKKDRAMVEVKLNEANSVILEANNRLTETNTHIEETNAQIEEANSQNKQINEDLVEKLGVANTRVTEKAKALLDANRNALQSQSKINDLSAKLDAKVVEFNSLSEKSKQTEENLNAQILTLSQDKQTKQAQLELIATNLDEKTEAIEAIQLRISILVEFISNLIDSQKKAQQSQSKRSTSQLNSLSEENTSLNKKIFELEGKIREAEIINQKTLLEKDGELRKASLKVEELSAANTESRQQLADSEDEKDRLSRSNSNLQMKLDTLQEEVNKQQAEITSNLAAIATKDSTIASDEVLLAERDKKITQLERQLAESRITESALVSKDIAISELNKNRGEESQRNRELERTNQELEKRIGQLSADKDQMKQKVDALTEALKSGHAMTLRCGYSSAGRIIPVFGSGSYGITMTATSIAKALWKEGYKVLMMDLDLVTPTANAYLGQPPLLPDVVQSISQLKPDERLYQTSLGILMKNGTDYFIDNRDNFMVEVAAGKRGNSLDFFSGLIGRMVASEFQAINWEELLNVLGSEYEFIIVDLGRIGAMQEQNMLINMFTAPSVAYKYVIVTTNDPDNLRMTWTKMQECRVNVARAIWMVNMADSTEDTDMMRKIMSRIPHRILTFSPTLYGKKKLFTDAIFKGQFSGVLDLVKGDEIK